MRPSSDKAALATTMGPAGRFEHEVALIELGRFARSQPAAHLDSGIAQESEAAPVHPRVGINRAGHNSRDPGLDNRFDAGRRAAVVTARLDIRIERRSTSQLAGLGKGETLGVRLPGTAVIRARNHLATPHHHGPNKRIGTGAAARQASLAQTLIEVLAIGGDGAILVVARAATWFVGHAPLLPSKPST